MTSAAMHVAGCGCPDCTHRRHHELLDAVANARQPRALTVDEAAGYLQVSTHTVLRAIRAGWLPALRVGRAFRISERVLAGLLESDVPNQPRRGGGH